MHRRLTPLAIAILTTTTLASGGSSVNAGTSPHADSMVTDPGGSKIPTLLASALRQQLAPCVPTVPRVTAAPKYRELALLSRASSRQETPSIHTLGSIEEGLVLEFELPSLHALPLEIAGETFHVLQIEAGSFPILEIGGGGFTGQVGAPMLPSFSRLIEIPACVAAHLEIVSLETTEVAGFRPIPVQPDEASGFVINRNAYAADAPAADHPAQWAHLGDPAIARGLRVVPITIHPVRYDPARETLEVATRIQIQITFSGQDVRNSAPRIHPVLSSSFDQLYRNLVVNYTGSCSHTGSRNAQVVSLGTYVIICPDDPEILAALEPLVEWRARKGYEVHLVTTTETGASKEDIQDWLRFAYATWDNPPEYITLIGDANGDISIPCWLYGGGSADHPYVKLDGDDLLPDAHIGRISVDSVDGLQLYVTKIVGYESTPYMAETDWYTRACLVGDPSYSGYTCIQIAQWLKTRLSSYGYADIDTVFTSPWVSGIRNCINRGDTVFSYRGYYNMSGFSTGHILALQNGWKMPFAVNLTCDTGSFNQGLARSEAWIRAGVPPNTPTGGIASIGTATTGTHTRYNNCVVYGIWRGIFWENMFHFGAALTRAKYELYVNYAEANMGAVRTYSHWNNLMGDSAGELWTAVPQAIEVDHPTQLPIGTNTVTIHVTADGLPCEEAYVCLWMEGCTHVGGYTCADGSIELPVTTPSEGEMKLTVTKHDHHPYLAAINVTQHERHVAYNTHLIDDDTLGSSNGNRDHVPNPGETIEIPVLVENFGTQVATEVTGTLTAAGDPYTTILDATEAFGDIPSGETAWSEDDFDIHIDPAAPHGHLIRLGLELQSGADSWHALLEIQVVSADFACDGVTLWGFGDTIDPGETGEISVRILNLGGAGASSVTGALISESPWVTVDDGYGSFGIIPADSVGENTADRFGLTVSNYCYNGHIAPMVLALQFSSGLTDTVHLALPIGTPNADDPTGADAYGYYAFDDTDLAFPQAPTYEWIELDPNHGGSGSSLAMTDEKSETIDLPFPFTYYGETFTRATICSNGWMAMGSTYLTNRRNWNIPAAGAPNYMIAPMWDDLYPSGSNTVYHWFDADNHRYIVQWARVKNRLGNTVQNFEAILYDPIHYPTPTGDGVILFQYDTFNNSDHIQHYCTVGIENGDQTDGLMYSYYGYYNAGGRLIQSGRAIKFLTLTCQPRGTLAGMITNDTNGGTPLGQATVHLLESGEQLTAASNGIYSGGVLVGTYTVVARHPSFAPDTAWAVVIAEEQATNINFALQDTLPPTFSATTDYPSTPDTQGPYDIYSTVIEYSDFEELSLIYNANGSGWMTIPLEEQGDNIYKASIPGQPYTTLVHYYLSGRDVGGNASTDPPNPPEEIYAFWILPVLFTDDMEGGAGAWTHYVVTEDFVDQWHLSEEENHTPGGNWAWKFGDDSGGDYEPFADGALVSEPFPLAGNSELTFWHWMDAEDSAWYPPYGYDGGLIEISVDGGDWTHISPVGGYPNLVRNRPQGPGPFPSELPFYSGTFDWQEACFSIEGVTGTVQLRFRFGSDYAAFGDGWYIDDVQVFTSTPGAAGVGDTSALPTCLALHQSSPNPFGTEDACARIRFDLPRPSNVRLQVFDANGRLLRTLIHGPMPRGQHLCSWNGRDAGARHVGSGVYFYVLEADGRQQCQRMLLLR